MTLEEINDTYGQVIWATAERYHAGTWESSDVYNEILLMLYAAIKSGQIPEEISVPHNRLVKSFVICRAIDIIRKEYHRKGITTDDSSEEDYAQAPDPEAPATGHAYEMEKAFIWDMLVTHLPKQYAIVIFELAFPSIKTIDIALKDIPKVLKDLGKEKYINGNLQIYPKHVMESLAPAINVSLQTISRIKSQAREIYEETMDIKLKPKVKYRTKGTL